MPSSEAPSERSTGESGNHDKGVGYELATVSSNRHPELDSAGPALLTTIVQCLVILRFPDLVSSHSDLLGSPALTRLASTIFELIRAVVWL